MSENKNSVTDQKQLLEMLGQNLGGDAYQDMMALLGDIYKSEAVENAVEIELTTTKEEKPEETPIKKDFNYHPMQINSEQYQVR